MIVFLFFFRQNKTKLSKLYWETNKPLWAISEAVKILFSTTTSFPWHLVFTWQTHTGRAVRKLFKMSIFRNNQQVRHLFYSQRLQYLFEFCHAHAHEMENQSLSNRYSALSFWTALRDRSGTTPIEVNNFDKSKRRSLRSAPRVDVIGKPGPGPYCGDDQLRLVQTRRMYCYLVHG